MKTTMPSDWKKRATCARWGGERRPFDPFLVHVEYETTCTGKCYGGGFNQLQMPPLAACNKWEQQYKK